MKPFSIRSVDDIVAIEQRPYSEFMEHPTVFAALSASAAQHAERRALTFIASADPAQPASSITYAELLACVAQAANLFHTIAAPAKPVVALLAPTLPDTFVALLAAEAVGVACPINFMLGEAHIAELLNASGANILVALGPNDALDIWPKVDALRAQCPGLKRVLALDVPGGASDLVALSQGLSTTLPLQGPATRADDLAALFHTGGTTGAPKLAQHTQGNQLHSAWGAAQLYAMTADDVIINGFPLFHVAGAFVYGLSALLSGAEIVIPTLLGMRNAEFVRQYWTFAARHRVTLLAAVPTVISALLGTQPGDAGTGRVRALLTGGSPLPKELAEAFERAFHIPVRNILGMTESAGIVTVEPFLAPRTPGACGLRLPFTQVQAVAADGTVCAPGESGILRLRGANVSPGYTDARRNAGIFSTDGWLTSGDIGHVDAQGRVFVTGRAKDVIIRGGHNIDPQVIEEALLQHPAVQMAAAVGLPDEYAGELPMAFVSLRPGAVVDEAELLAFAAQRIPERPAYPKRVVVLSAVPVTAIGKVYKPRLRCMAWQDVLQDRLAQAGLANGVRAEVQESPRGLQAVLTAGEDLTPAQRAQVAQVMQPFALDYTLETT